MYIVIPRVTKKPIQRETNNNPVDNSKTKFNLEESRKEEIKE